MIDEMKHTAAIGGALLLAKLDQLGDWLLYGAIFLASVLGGWGNLLQAHQKTSDPIPRRQIHFFFVSGFLSSVILVPTVAHYYGVSWLLVPVSAASGFGAAPVLGASVKAMVALANVLGSIAGRLMPPSTPSDDDKKN